MLPSDWGQILSLGINSATLIVAVKVVRQFSRLEFQVELMWKSFSKHLNADREDDKS